MSDISEFNVGSPLFGIGFKKKDSTLRLKEGETIIIKKNVGSFWKPRYIRKALTLKNGKVEIQKVDLDEGEDDNEETNP